MSIIHKYSEDLLEFFLSKKRRIHKKYLCSEAQARKIVTFTKTTHIRFKTQENVKSNKTQQHMGDPRLTKIFAIYTEY